MSFSPCSTWPRIALATSLAVGAGACCPPPGESEKFVLAAFDAYQRGDASGVQATLSDEGRSVAKRSCGRGLAIACLSGNYGSPGTLVSRAARCLGRGEDGYGVELRTVWRRGSKQSTLCQHFSVSAGWERYKIDSFGEPAPCD